MARPAAPPGPRGECGGEHARSLAASESNGATEAEKVRSRADGGSLGRGDRKVNSRAHGRAASRWRSPSPRAISRRSGGTSIRRRAKPREPAAADIADPPGDGQDQAARRGRAAGGAGRRTRPSWCRSATSSTCLLRCLEPGRGGDRGHVAGNPREQLGTAGAGLSSPRRAAIGDPARSHRARRSTARSRTARRAGREKGPRGGRRAPAEVLRNGTSRSARDLSALVASDPETAAASCGTGSGPDGIVPGRSGQAAGSPETTTTEPQRGRPERDTTQ